MRYLMPRLLSLPGLILAAAPAAAHPGHIAEGLAGHDHWVAGAAIGIAIAVGIWGALKGKGRTEEASADEAGTADDAEEQPA